MNIDIDQLKRSHRQLMRLRQCFTSCYDISSSLSLEVVLDSLMLNVMDNLGAENCSLYLVDESRNELFLSLSKGPLGSAIPAGQRLKPGEKIPGRAWQERRTIHVTSEELEPGRDLISPLAGSCEVETTLCIPLMANDRVLGVAKITNKRLGGVFDDDDQEIFELACRQAAISIQNAYHHLNELELQSLESEFLRAEELRKMLLPDSDPALPGCRISASSISCKKFGGDYLGYLAPQNGESVLGIVVADAVGHDLSAGLLMVSLRAYIHSQSKFLDKPQTMIGNVNALFAQDTEGEGYFCTLFLLVLDQEHKRLRWVSAGNPPALLYDPAADSFQELKGGGPCLGCIAETEYQVFECPAPAPGSVCVVATDGIYEAAGPDGGMFGAERVKEIIRSHAGQPAEAVRAALLDSLQDYCGTEERDDDITIAVVSFD